MPIAGRTGSAIGVTENETYDSVIRSLREFALKKFDTEPPWRKKGSELVTGYIPDWGDNRAQSIVPQPRQGIGNPSHAGPRSQDSGKTRGDRDAGAGRTWTLELHELDSGMTLGTLVDWISSGVLTSQPQPDDALAHQLLANRGLHLYPDPAADPCTPSRNSIGYVNADP